MMDTSKVTISPDTLGGNHVTPGRRKQLRQEIIIQLIKSKPNGTPTSLAEVSAAASLKSTNRAYLFLQDMVSDGLLSREKTGPSIGSPVIYYVNDARTVKPARRVDDVPPPRRTRGHRLLSTFAPGLRQGLLLGVWLERLTRVCGLAGPERIGA